MMSNLPPHVYAVKDRHGKTRHRYVRKGWKSRYLPGAVGSAEFHTAYAEAVDGVIVATPIAAPVAVIPKSLDDLFVRMKGTTRWKKKKPKTQHVQTLVIERFLNRVDKKKRRYGSRPAGAVTVMWLETIFGEMAKTPSAANDLRKRLAAMMDVAVKLNWREENPVRYTEPYPEAKDGYHTWTDAEIEQYRKHHALGTMARLTLELALNTAARRCNVATLTRDDIKDGRIFVDHAKGNNDTSVRLLATTKAALDALPAAPIRHLVTTSTGGPWSVEGLGNKMRKWCNEAGLKHCSMHGIRKATSRLLAEHGATDAEGQAVTGHKKAATFQRYRAKANRAVLADRAFSNLEVQGGFQPSESEGNSDV